MSDTEEVTSDEMTFITHVIADLPGPIAQYERLFHLFAARLMPRVKAARLSLEYDDLMQEIRMTWMACVRGFDPQRGIKFVTYFSNAVRHNWQAIYGKYHDELLDTATTTIDSNKDDGFANSIFDVIENMDAIPQDEAIIRRESIEKGLRKAPLLNRLLHLVQDEPEDLMQELEAAKAQQEYAHQLGVKVSRLPPRALTPRVLLRIFGANWRARERLIKEIEQVSSHVA
jgi:hypothetical protein